MLNTKRTLEGMSENVAPGAHDAEGGLDFTPNGFIGKFSSGIFFAIFGIEGDPAAYKADLVTTSPNSGKHTLYFKRDDAARAAAKAYQQTNGTEKPPIVNEVWRLSAPVSSLKNVDQAKFDRSPVLSFDIRVVGPRSEHRHGYQLLALPSAVLATAKFADADITLPNPLLELLLSGTEFNEELMTRMIGIPKATAKEEGYWLNSELGQWRTRLWAALGEPDPLKTTNSVKPTEATDLLYCLSMAGGWKNPQWCRVVMVPDPGAVGAVYNDKRQRVAVVWEFFADEKEATAVAEAELAKRAANQPVEPEAEGEVSTEPNIPPEWKDIAADWRAAIADELHKVDRDDRDIASELSVGLPFVKSWKRYLAAQK